MPTGYTQILHERDTTFPEFALRCARAFGALVHMREDRMDEPIRPDVCSTFYDSMIGEAYSEIAMLRKLDTEGRKTLLNDEKNKSHKNAVKRIAEMNVVKARYEQMKEDVQDWIVPTDEHKGMKAFMIDQLNLCASDYDTSYYEDNLQTPQASTAEEAQEYVFQRIKKLQKDLVYYTEQRDKEAERVERRNEWIRQLQESLE